MTVENVILEDGRCHVSVRQMKNAPSARHLRLLMQLQLPEDTHCPRCWLAQRLQLPLRLRLRDLTEPAQRLLLKRRD